MANYWKIVKKNLGTIEKTGKTLKDIYSVIVSHGDLIAYERLIDFEINEVTYRAHDLEIREFSSYLRHAHKDILREYIAIDLANSPNFLVAFWGVLMSGNKPYLVNSFYPQEIRKKLLKRLNIRLVITDAPDYTDFSVVNIEGFDKNCPKITDEFWQNEFALSSTLTGLEAKICVFDGESVVNQILNTKGILKANDWLMNDYQNRIKVAMILPLFHIFGIMAGYFWFSFFGRTMVFFKDSSPETIRGTIHRHKVTHIFAPPVLFHKLYREIMNGIANEPKRRQHKFSTGIKLAYILQNIFPSLGVRISKRLFREVLAAAFGKSPAFMISGGAHIDKDALKTINCIGYPLFNGYGTTETSIAGAALSKKIRARTNGSIGKPFNSVRYSVDENGVLAISGKSICKRIISLDGEQSGFDSIKTNDLVKLVKGQYFIIGRESDIFIGESGENISPDTIQNELKIRSANRYCVLELKGALSIVLEYGENLPNTIIANEIGQIKKDLTNIPYGKYISNIFVTRQPIANANAIKVSRALLRKRIDEHDIILDDFKAVKSESVKQTDTIDDETMSLIKQAFATALDTDVEISTASDFFFDLNGDSLGYIMLISDLESIFNVKFNLEKNQNLRTPESFYKYIMETL